RAASFEEDSTKALADLSKAAQLDPGQWRYGQSLILYALTHEEKEKALALATDYYQKFPDNYMLGMLYIKSLMLNNQYEQANSILQKINILPNEGATDGRQLYHETQLMLARNALSSNKPDHALQSL